MDKETEDKVRFILTSLNTDIKMWTELQLVYAEGRRWKELACATARVSQSKSMHRLITAVFEVE